VCLSSEQGDVKASNGIGIAELASAFAALDSMDGDDTVVVTADDVASALDRQRTMILTLVSSSLLESSQQVLSSGGHVTEHAL
jgi:hypothetical protein